MKEALKQKRIPGVLLYSRKQFAWLKSGNGTRISNNTRNNESVSSRIERRCVYSSHLTVVCKNKGNCSSERVTVSQFNTKHAQKHTHIPLARIQNYSRDDSLRKLPEAPLKTHPGITFSKVHLASSADSSWIFLTSRGIPTGFRSQFTRTTIDSSLLLQPLSSFVNLCQYIACKTFGMRENPFIAKDLIQWKSVRWS